MKHYLNTFKPYLPYVIGGLLILMIFGFDLFGSQTVFLLDYVPTPIRVRDRGHYLTIPLIWMVHDGLLNTIGYILGSKMYLVTIVIITMMLGYRWGSLIQSHTKSEGGNYLPLLGMILMICNPVFASRMQTQPGVWLGIVLLGRGLYHLIKHRHHLSIKHSSIIGLYRGIAMMSMNHASFMIVVLLGAMIVTHRSWKSLGRASIIGVIVGLLNLNRIIAGVLGYNTTAAQANTFSQANITEFMTRDHSGLGPIATSMLGYGFWGEKTGSAYAPTRANPRRWVAGLIILIIAGYGLYRWHQHAPRQGIIIGLIIVISLILGVGVASDILQPSIQWLYDYVPGYRGLREPHKRVGLYMMCIVPLVLYGVARGHKLYQDYITQGWMVVTLALISIARTPGVMSQMMQRYDTTDYPASYTQVRNDLINLGGSGQWLQLPRHSYHRCQWTNKVISNPTASYLYPVPVITSDNIEIGQLYTNSSNERSRVIEGFIQSQNPADLSDYNIQGIIYLSQCADYKRYEWIDQMSGVQKIIDQGDVQVYQFVD